MPKYVEVEFQSIGLTKVYVPPNNLIWRILEKRYPYPPMPKVTEETAHGREITMEIEDDPEYLAEKEAVDETRRKAHERYQLLFSLKDVTVPDEWPGDEELELIRILEKDWKPREDDEGRKLDYIERYVFYDPMDETAYEQAMIELLGLDLDLAEFFRKAVRRPLEGAAA